MADSNKDDVAETLFDPQVSQVLELLEGGPMAESKICEKLSITAEDLAERLSPLAKRGLVTKSGDEYSADGEKLAETIESSGRFDGAIDKITQMDSYLN